MHAGGRSIETMRPAGPSHPHPPGNGINRTPRGNCSATLALTTGFRKFQENESAEEPMSDVSLIPKLAFATTSRYLTTEGVAPMTGHAGQVRFINESE